MEDPDRSGGLPDAAPIHHRSINKRSPALPAHDGSVCLTITLLSSEIMASIVVLYKPNHKQFQDSMLLRFVDHADSHSISAEA